MLPAKRQPASEGTYYDAALQTEAIRLLQGLRPDTARVRANEVAEVRGLEGLNEDRGGATVETMLREGLHERLLE